MTAILSPSTSARSLISGRLFDRLTARIVAEHEIEPRLAERIMDQALAFLAATVTPGGNWLSPSQPVDIGWHTFILYTREYAEFCNRVAGRFIDHVPNDDPDAPSEDADPSSVRARTLAAIQSAGYAVDPDLWPNKAGRCSQDDCGASGENGNENTETRIPPPDHRR
jgi:hypothetical protein